MNKKDNLPKDFSLRDYMAGLIDEIGRDIDGIFLNTAWQDIYEKDSDMWINGKQVKTAPIPIVDASGTRGLIVFEIGGIFLDVCYQLKHVIKEIKDNDIVVALLTDSSVTHCLDEALLASEIALGRMEYTPPIVKKASAAKELTCTCSTIDLVRAGCQCGYLKDGKK